MQAVASTSSDSIDIGHLDDAAIVVSIARGDRESLAALYDRYAAVMLALGTRILGASREAEDVLHDVFVEVWKRAGDYDPSRGRVKAWLFVRMRSRCIDRKRLTWNQRTQALDERDDARPPTAEAQTLAADSDRLRAAISALPPEQAMVILLGYFEGRSCREISEHLHLPVGTVKSRLASAMRKLRDRLDPPHLQVTS